MTPKVSVIVPVYKAEAYLHRCVDSLLVQTLQDYEILLIDDGSPDKSGEICDEYAKKDERVRVFHKENGGVSSARQCGIDNSRGEYTIHADPDDWVEPNMLEKLYAKAKEDDADMVICDFYEEHRKEQIYNKQQPSALDYQIVFRELFQRLHCSCWNKLIRRACYNKYKVHFPIEMNLWEDGYVMFNLTMYPIKISYLPEAFYHYDNYTNGNSIVRKPTIRDLNSMKYLISYLEKSIDDKKYIDELYNKKYEAKSLAFRLGLPYKEFVELYEEINHIFISHNLCRSEGNLNKLIAYSLQTNRLIYYCLNKFYFYCHGK